VDEVEVTLRVCPRFIDVIYLKAEVWRHEGWLNWGQVDTGNGASRILVGKFAGENLVGIYLRSLGGMPYITISSYMAQEPMPQPTSRAV
jgi:hypothetical protein